MSWIATCLVTGTVWEMFDEDDKKKAEQINSVKVETAMEYLCRVNQEIKEENGE